ncbi:MAG: magnesium chelatase domain-containing protein, partial [Candidatus Omnitrophica bacterium]|nr:magnesium chelatase domain-containing protein [Candidatus Omnitrophota bacterium]
VDLGVILALASALDNKRIQRDLIVFGEVGLAGEVRKVSFAEKRIKEAVKLGFRECLMPCGNLLEKGGFDIKISEITNIKEALKKME